MQVLDTPNSTPSLIGEEAVARAIQDADMGGKSLPSIRPAYMRLAAPAISAHLAALKEAGWFLATPQAKRLMARLLAAHAMEIRRQSGDDNTTEDDVADLANELGYVEAIAAGMVKQVDTSDLKSDAFVRDGSNPSAGTNSAPPAQNGDEVTG